MKDEQVVGVPVQVAPELHTQFRLVAQPALDVRVLHAVGVPLQVPPPPPEYHSQLADALHPLESVSEAQGVGVPVQTVPSQTQPGNKPHVGSSADAAEHEKVFSPSWQTLAVAAVYLHPAIDLQEDSMLLAAEHA